MKTAKSFNKQSGITYVYEVLESHYDPVKKHAVSKRRLIGKIDPETGDIIPTGKAGRPKKNSVPSAEPDQPAPETVNTARDQPDYKALYEAAAAEITARDERIRQLESALLSLQSSLAASASLCSDLLVSLHSTEKDIRKSVGK